VVEHDGRWTIEQVAAVAPSPAAVAAAEGLTDTARWTAAGADDRSLWGRCRGSGTEPYDTMVDHVDVAWRCTCPSRRSPCKHALALLLMWVRGSLAPAVAPDAVARWSSEQARRAAATSADRGRDPSPSPDPDRPAPAPSPPPDDHRDARDDRVARMLAGLRELDRWLDDRMRTGLADPSLARYGTWDDLAARLVDARAGALANRVRRLAGLVGSGPDWQSRVLAELGVLHLLAQAGQRVPELPGPLGDAVATAAGWQVRQADVLAGVPETDDWVVAGRSDQREDRIEVRRVWLRGAASGRWAMVLSFAAYRQSLDSSLPVGAAIRADLHRYPGGSLRALVGAVHARSDGPAAPPASSVAAACDSIGAAVAAEPWLDRVAVSVAARPGLVGGRWVLGDDGGSLPMAAQPSVVAKVLAAAAEGPATLTVEWTPAGVVPLSIHLHDRTIDVGPRADPSFVGVA
jgi:hypothetical protein